MNLIFLSPVFLSLNALSLRQPQGIPYMFNSPSLLFDLSGRQVTATLPGWGTGMARRMSLGDRLQNAISPRALSLFLTPAFISINKVRTAHGNSFARYWSLLLPSPSSLPSSVRSFSTKCHVVSHDHCVFRCLLCGPFQTYTYSVP